MSDRMGNKDNRLGVDIGGTFTDVVLETAQGRYSTKVLTTYAAPEDAIIDGLHQVCAKAGISAQQIGQIIHGTTLATNSLIERRGARTALITTKGFRDVIEMRTESRFEQYDLNLKLPDPLLPRERRYVLEERIGASGEVLIPLTRQPSSNWPTSLPRPITKASRSGCCTPMSTMPTRRWCATCWAKSCPACWCRCPARCHRRCANTNASTPPLPMPTSSR
jgi:hypothetical protein